MDLRPYQARAIDAAREAFRAGSRRVVLVAPTGSGKTRIAAEVVRRAFDKTRSVLWLAPRRELVRQAHAAIVACGVPAGILMAGTAPTPGVIQVASIGTVHSRGLLPSADLIVFDEVQHAVSDAAANLIRSYPSAHAIGLTATPERSDGVGLGAIFDRLIVVAQVRELVDAGYLAPCDIRAPAEKLNVRQIAQRPVDAYLEHARGTSAIVFAPTVAKAEQFAVEFQDAGIAAGIVHAKTPHDIRDRYLRAFEAGEIPVLCNVRVLTEGTDLPRAQTAILAHDIGTAGGFIQIVGRVRRIFPGKDRAIVLDLHGSSHVHGHPDEPREYSLEGTGIRRCVKPDSICRVCGCPIEPGAICDDCGTGPRKPKPLTVKEIALVKFEKRLETLMSKPMDPRTKQLAEWIREGRDRGWKPRAAAFKFKAAFGYFPAKAVMVRAERETA